MNAIDTNIFIYGLDDSEPAKQAKAHELVARLVMSSPATNQAFQRGQLGGDALAAASRQITKKRC